MYNTLIELFDMTRELLGGSEEGALKKRWPDRRMFAYLRDFCENRLAAKAGISDASLLLSVTITPPGYQVGTLPAAVRRVHGVLCTGEDDPYWLAPVTREQLLQHGCQPGEDEGTPTAYYLETLSGLPVLTLHPKPETEVAVDVWGEGTYALTTPSYDSYGMMNNANPLTLPIPAAFKTAALEHLLWYAKRSGEEYSLKEREYQRQQAELAMAEALREYNVMIPEMQVIVEPWIPRMR